MGFMVEDKINKEQEKIKEEAHALLDQFLNDKTFVLTPTYMFGLLALINWAWTGHIISGTNLKLIIKLDEGINFAGLMIDEDDEVDLKSVKYKEPKIKNPLDIKDIKTMYIG